MLKLIRIAVSHYSELVLAGTFGTMIAWEVLELTVLESSHGASLSLALLVHALQVALILTATALALRAWREKTVRERALATLVEKVVVAQEEERRRVAYDVQRPSAS
jgi:signal transduction histidine kinase